MTTATAHHTPRSRSKAPTAVAAARAARQAGADTVQDFAALIADAEAARVRLQKSLVQARGRLAMDVSSISTHGRRAASAADDYVRAQPWSVIGLAALAAFGAGLLLTRR